MSTKKAVIHVNGILIECPTCHQNQYTEGRHGRSSLVWDSEEVKMLPLVGGSHRLECACGTLLKVRWPK